MFACCCAAEEEGAAVAICVDATTTEEARAAVVAWQLQEEAASVSGPEGAVVEGAAEAEGAGAAAAPVATAPSAETDLLDPSELRTSVHSSVLAVGKVKSQVAKEILGLMEFPMYVISREEFLTMTEVKSHQVLKREGVLAEHIEGEGFVTFVSHQWCDEQHPDPLFVQLGLLQRVIRKAMTHDDPRVQVDYFSSMVYRTKAAVGHEDLHALCGSSLWYDYFSVPQLTARSDADKHKDLAGLTAKAVASIPVYVALSRLFIILAPVVEHSSEAGVVLDYTTWKQRGWCRFERLARMLSPAETHMLLVCSEETLLQVGSQEYLFDPVGEGDFAVEDDKRVIAPVADLLINDKLRSLREAGDDASFKYMFAYSKTILRGLPVEGVRKTFSSAASSDTILQPQSPGRGTPRGPSALLVAALAGDIIMVKRLLAGRADVQARLAVSVPGFFMFKGESPLHAAAKCGHGGVVQQLLRTQAAVDARDALRSEPLAFAAIGGSVRVAKLLVEAHADTNARNAFGAGALDNAVWFRRMPVVEMLVAAGASVAPNRHGSSCLHYAAMWGAQHGAVRRLLDLRAAPDAAEDHGWTRVGVLHFAASLPHRASGSTSLSAVVAYHSKGATPLMLAAIFGRTSEAKELLQGRADPRRRNGRGKTALQIAQLLEHPRHIVEVFRGDLGD